MPPYTYLRVISVKMIGRGTPPFFFTVTPISIQNERQIYVEHLSPLAEGLTPYSIILIFMDSVVLGGGTRLLLFFSFLFFVVKFSAEKKKKRKKK